MKKSNQSTANHLVEIITALATAKVQFIVCGGVAAVLHGVERMTVDIDIAIDFSSANVKRLTAVIAKLGLFPRVPVSPEILADKKKRRDILKQKGAIVFTFIDPDEPFRQVDVFLSEDNSYNALAPESDVFSVGGHEIRVLSKRQLISMKMRVRPLREKDTFDIKALENLP
jgi:Nucleotidyl transferase AbiEii toxin, Type IV TA system